MKTKTLEALKASIIKWEKNVEFKKVDDIVTGVQDCPLCALYNNHHIDCKYKPEKNCSGCPVKQASGQKYCQDTPYYSVVKTISDYEDGDLGDEALPIIKGYCEEEVKFLKSLLPTE